MPKVFLFLFQGISAVKHANALDAKIQKIQIDKKNLILAMTRKFKSLKILTKSPSN
jgi:hypothetical protein